jgi:hypothetical protein
MTKQEKKEAILDKQFTMAMEGSVEMLKWLGIQLAGQSNQPTNDKDDLPSGFNVSLIPNKYEKAVADEYEANRDEFLEWKESRVGGYLEGSGGENDMSDLSLISTK